MVKQAHVRLKRARHKADQVSAKNQRHVGSHYKWREANAVLIVWLGQAPKRHNPKAEKQGLSNKPRKPQPLAAKARDCLLYTSDAADE